MSSTILDERIFPDNKNKLNTMDVISKQTHKCSFVVHDLCHTGKHDVEVIFYLHEIYMKKNLQIHLASNSVNIFKLLFQCRKFPF